MVTAGDTSTLNQILVTLTNLGERLAVVEADLKTVIRDHTKDLDDHESRIRHLEAVGRDAITREDLVEREQKQAEVVASALSESDRKANRRVLWLGLGVSIVVAFVNTIQILRYN